jgi:hypothetical protein
MIVLINIEEGLRDMYIAKSAVSGDPIEDCFPQTGKDSSRRSAVSGDSREDTSPVTGKLSSRKKTERYISIHLDSSTYLRLKQQGYAGDSLCDVIKVMLGEREARQKEKQLQTAAVSKAPEPIQGNVTVQVRNESTDTHNNNNDTLAVERAVST